MKKLKIANLSPTPLMIILAAGVLVSVPIRVFQLLNCVDPTTGFWAAKDFTVLLLYILCGVIGLVAFFLSFFSGIMTKPKFKEGKDLGLGICGLIFSASLLYEAVMLVLQFIKILSAYTTDSNGQISYYMTTSGGFAVALAALFGALGAVYLTFVSISAITGNDNYSSKRILGLCPALWAMFRLIYHFTNPINYRNVSSLFLEILMLCFAMIFFLSFARIASEINEEQSMMILWFTGVCTALLAFLCGLAPLILVITGKGSLIPASYPLHYCDFGLAIFITAFLFTVTPLTNEVGED